MKIKINIALSVILLMLFVSGCNDFLNEQPQADFTTKGMSEDTTGTGELISKYKSKAEAEAELFGAYNAFKSDIFQIENLMINDVQSDNCYVGGDGSDEEYIDKIVIYPTNKKVELIWRQYLALAGAATGVLENVKLMKNDADITEADKKRIMAEAKFIRAWAYFDMVRIWGGIPMTNQLVPTLTAKNIEKWHPVIYPARSSEEEVYEQILKDLDENETIVHLDSYNRGAYKATKGAAYGLLAKIWGTKGIKSARDYQKVVSYADKVIEQGYSLLPEFDQLWNPDNKYSTESIFEVYFTSASGNTNWAYWVLLKETEDGAVTWRRYCTPTHDLIAKFDKVNDKRYASSIIWKPAPYHVYYPANNYPFSYKIREKNSEIILMRFADILLLKAEALVELNRPTEAIDIVNQIRNRAGISDLDRNMSKETARLAVENERQLELYAEGQRWYDLVRNERMVEVMSKHKDQNGKLQHAGIAAFRSIWPIPQSEIDQNEKLTQNDGY